MEVTCDNQDCGKSYLDYRARVEKAVRHFCSAECCRKCRAGSGNPKWKGGQPEVNCLQCGKLFRKAPGVEKFCSVACKNKSLRRQLTTAEALRIINDFRKSGLSFFAFSNEIGVSESQLRKRLMSVVPDDFRASTEASRLKWSEVYRRGRNFEYRVRRHLMSIGYICMVSPRSQGAADLLAVRQGEILLVQCKMGCRVRRSERLRLIEMSEHAHGRAIVAGLLLGECVFWEVSRANQRRKMVSL